MTIRELLKQNTLSLSFEVFPPKTDVGMEKLCGEGGVLEQLYTLNPDYISCTYGAGGTNVGKNLEVLDKIVADGKCTGVTHFTCIGNTKEGIREQLQTYLDHGINHMLALRGDLPFGWTGTGGDLHYATELVKFARQEFGDKFTIAVAGSPEGHIACRSIEADIAFLKQKQDNGADYIMTQLCWDMDQFRWWLDAIRAAGIWMPVDVGIMPILDQIAACKPDAIHSLDPQAGITIPAVRKAVGPDICLVGNVNCGLLQTGTDEEVRADVLRSLREGMANGRGYIFSTSNCVYTGMPLERYEMMMDLWRQYGNYDTYAKNFG